MKERWSVRICLTRAARRKLGSRSIAVFGQPGSVEGTVPSDNVGCFFRLMQFDAVAPGFDDFYFGPARLRQIARFLAEPATGDERPTQFLAANLLIRPTGAEASFAFSALQLPRPLRQAFAPSEAVHFDLPSDVLPWLKQVTVYSAVEADAYIRLPGKPG